MLLVRGNSENFKCPSLIGVTILGYISGSDSDSINTSSSDRPSNDIDLLNIDQFNWKPHKFSKYKINVN